MKDNSIRSKLELLKKQVYRELKLLKSEIIETGSREEDGELPNSSCGRKLNCRINSCNIKLIKHRKSYRRVRPANTYRKFKKVTCYKLGTSKKLLHDSGFML